MIDTTQFLNKNAMFNLTYVVDEVCPQCGGEMRAWKHGKGGNVCIHEEKRGDKLIWTGCGFKELKRKEKEETRYLYHKMIVDDNLGYLRRNSIVGNENVLERKLEGFNDDSQESKNILNKAKIFTNELINKRPVHVFLTGPIGTGKTHLSVGIANEFLERSKYNQKVMFISYSELYAQMKTMYQVKGAAEELEKNILVEIKKADLVILDDLGAELGGISSDKQDKRATEPNVTLLNRILEAREDKNLIVTTNLTSKDISLEYGQRCLSRILKHMKDEHDNPRVIKTNGLVDFRRK